MFVEKFAIFLEISAFGLPSLPKSLPLFGPYPEGAG
jgi:hypothetical protein